LSRDEDVYMYICIYSVRERKREKTRETKERKRENCVAKRQVVRRRCMYVYMYTLCEGQKERGKERDKREGESGEVTGSKTPCEQVVKVTGANGNSYLYTYVCIHTHTYIYLYIYT